MCALAANLAFVLVALPFVRDCDAADGIDLRRGLLESGSPLPIIFMTTVDDKATRRQAMDVGCIASLRKPFPAKMLIGPIDKATG